MRTAPRKGDREREGVATNLGSILKARQLSSPLLYYALLDPVLSESCDDIRHPPSPLISFGNFRTRSVTSGPASATLSASAVSELAPLWLRAEAMRGLNVGTHHDWLCARRMRAVSSWGRGLRISAGGAGVCWEGGASSSRIERLVCIQQLRD